MYFSFIRLHWLRFIGAITAIGLASIYLAGFEAISLTGFGLIGLLGISIGIKLRNGTLPAQCDLCGNKGTLKAEYGTGFSNAHLLLSCPECGRVVNKSQQGIKPEKE